EDRVGGKRRWNIDHGRIAPGRRACFMNRIEYREVEMARAAFARRHPPDHLGAVGDRLLGVEGALGAGEPLAQHLGRRIDEDRHQAASLTAVTTFWAASARFS